ncbi:thioredoxin family protein [Sinomicrobium weinanense]|uniref:Thioredoxin family protein n=1 Tax=Sinomicrobium weinanense TaxID=2842200 RepID=A0A926JQ67_9FLAO|nr:thioredoxin family protein [Sinomicrobium weinanense]MBC9795435.1 thioredoxin family protein [Sinomicrobium weinanense]MBU3123960.1 thioredoxin family protein [Sinomicrobium weinanense]
MKKIYVYLCLSLFILSCKEEKKKDHTEIHFTEGSFEDILARGKQEEKLIFIDCYTSWCAPCKWMEKNVFVKKSVYDFYNESFINYKIDMEKGEGPELARRYQVNSFPTYLFLNGDGELVHLAKSKMEADKFINEGKKAMDPEQAFGTLTRKYLDNEMNNEQMARYAIQLNKLRDPRAGDVRDKLLKKVDSAWLKSEYGWKLTESFVYDDQSELFHFMDSHKEYFMDRFGKDAVYEVYQRALQRKLYQSSKENNAEQFFEQLDSLKTLTSNPRDIAILHCQFYLNNVDEEKFISTSDDYLKNHLQDDEETIAFIARSAYNYRKENPKILNQAAHLIEIAYEMAPDNYGIVSTYAQILGHAGQKEKALAAARKAVKIADTISSKIKKLAEKNLKEIQESN